MSRRNMNAKQDTQDFKGFHRHSLLALIRLKLLIDSAKIAVLMRC